MKYSCVHVKNDIKENYNKPFKGKQKKFMAELICMQCEWTQAVKEGGEVSNTVWTNIYHNLYKIFTAFQVVIIAERLFIH